MPQLRLRMTVLILVIIFAVAPIATAFGAVILASRDAILPTPPTGLMTVKVGSETDDGIVQATLRVTTQPTPVQLRSPGGEGVVTDIVRSGDIVRTGTVVLSVSGRDVIAAASARPIVDEVGPGSSGEDVELLASVLAKLGVYRTGVVDDSVYGTSMATAIRALEERIGAPVSGIFRPEYLVWLPNRRFRTSETHVSIGEPSPGVGEVIASAATGLTGVSLVFDGPNPARLEADQHELLVGTESFDLTSDASSVVRRQWARLRRALDGESESLVTLQRRTSLERSTVPASALIETATGDVCLLGGSQDRAIPILVVGGTPTVVYVEGVPPGASIVANPPRSSSELCTDAYP